MGPTMEQVAEYIRYNPQDGKLYWVKDPNSRGPRKLGQEAGSRNTFGHVMVGILGHKLYAHRIAWLLTYGRWPKEIDHKNGDPADNRLSNLREVPHTHNLGNANYGPMRGIERHGRKYRVRIGTGEKRTEVGSFATLEQAIAARDAAHAERFGECSYFDRR